MLTKKNQFENVLLDYTRYLRTERGLLENSIKSYKQDLSEFGAYIQKENILLVKVDRFTILDWLNYLQNSGKSCTIELFDLPAVSYTHLTLPTKA